MTSHSKPKLTPKLRFPEFRNVTGWDRKLGNTLFDQISNRVAPLGLPILAITQEHGAIPRDAIDYHVSVTDKSVETYKEVRPGDFIISLRSFQGGIEYSEYHGICSPAYVILRKKTDLSDPFFKHHLKSYRFIQQLTKNLEGLRDGKMISYKQFSELLLPWPHLSEQQKIAECLDSLDELIGVENQKIDALKAQKKGLMQQLFPREGETQPRLRFPEFQGTRNWEEVALGEIAEIKLGKMLDKQKHTTGRCLPYLNNMSVRWGEINTSTLPVMYFDDEELDRYGLRAGDVVVCEGGEPGRAAVWDGRLPDLKFQKAIHRVRFNVSFEPCLLVFYLELVAGTPRFEMLFTGGGIKHLTRETFAQLKIHLASPAEQKRVAECLAALNDQIAAQAQKVESLKIHKKGLMQQLFPSLSQAEV